MSQSIKPAGYATSVTTLYKDLSMMFSSIMTVENSPLKKLDPRIAHMVFQVLAFMWSGIFAVMIGSTIAFGISAAFHIALITGVFLTVWTFNEAEKRPETFNHFIRRSGYNGRAPGGEHE